MTTENNKILFMVPRENQILKPCNMKEGESGYVDVKNIIVSDGADTYLPGHAFILNETNVYPTPLDSYPFVILTKTSGGFKVSFTKDIEFFTSFVWGPNTNGGMRVSDGPCDAISIEIVKSVLPEKE